MKNPKGISSFSPALPDLPRRSLTEAGERATLGGESQNDINPEGVESLRAKRRCNPVGVEKCFWDG
jgi:hypothetical protein